MIKSYNWNTLLYLVHKALIACQLMLKTWTWRRVLRFVSTDGNSNFYRVFVMQYYDVRKECIGSLCYDFSNMEKFLNQKSVRSALGVGNMDFVSCSSKVYSAMLMDWMRNLEVGIPALIDDGIKVLVYAGEYDLICNWLGKFTMFIIQNPPFEVP